jgi:DNA polymerase-3 subunit delta'
MSFDAILDQEVVVRALRAAIEKERVAHAYIFVGPSGVGRKLAASVFARSLNCEQAQGVDPCGECSNCRLIAEGKHPDVQTIMPVKRSSTITVEQIEALLPFAHMRPLRGKHKVFIFSEADRLRIETANKMLKTLEEPPPQTAFILITEKIENVLPTVASRCQPIKFGRLRTESVKHILIADFDVDPQSAATAAGLAGGQVTRGLEFADSKRIEIVLDIVKSLESLPARMSTYDGLLAFFSESKETLQAEAEDKVSNFGEDLAASVKTSIENVRKSYVDRHYKDLLNDCLGLLLTLYRDMLVVKETDSDELVINRNRIAIIQNMRGIEEASQFCSHFVGEDRVFMDMMLSLRGT